MAGTGREIEYQTFLCLTKVHSRKKFGLHKENDTLLTLHYDLNVWQAFCSNICELSP